MSRFLLSNAPCLPPEPCGSPKGQADKILNIPPVSSFFSGANHLWRALFSGLSAVLVCLALSVGCNPATAEAASAPTLARLQAEFDALDKDSAKGGLRHNWLQLDTKITALAGRSKGDAKAEALYLSARCLDALGKRSFNSTDLKAAIEKYQKVAKDFPKHKLAPASRYAATAIAATRLKDREFAKKLADSLKVDYPSSPEAGKVDELLRSTPAASTRTSGAGASGKSDGKSGSAASRAAKDTRSRAEQLGLEVRTVMIDPGHGGKDPGAQVPGLDERNLTLEMAKILGAELKKNGFEVLYTRTGNTYLGLDKRTDLANSSKADLFISIHANANTNPKMHGLETYYLSPADSKDASKVAARENSVSVSQVNDVQFILADLMRDTKTEESRTLARMVHKNVLAQVRAGKYSLHDNGARPAPFYVLMGAKIPAILLEMGYMTNADNLKLLKTKDFLQRQAQGVVKGIKEYRTYVQKGME